jgi:2,3-bisphosphoglycerate-dependent phosphoglycerate mutase
MPPRPKRPPTSIWIARHGQTESNRSGLFCGHSETSLTDLGRSQAKALGERLRDVELTAIYTSDFSRAIETAVIATLGREIPAMPDPDLRELWYGEWEMQRESNIRRTHPEQFGLMRAEDPAWQPPGGENIAAVRRRTSAALRRIAARHAHQQVLIVGHGTAINCMLAEVLGMADSHVFRVDVANCGLSRVTAFKERMVVSLLNDTSHIDRLPAVSRA